MNQQRFLWIGRLEAISFLLLLGVGLPLKYAMGQPLGVRLIGPVHGLAFLAYLWCLAESAGAGLWSRRELARLVVAAFLPAGTLLNEALVRERLR